MAERVRGRNWPADSYHSYIHNSNPDLKAMMLDMKNVSFEENTEEKQNAFCGIWDTAKPALELMTAIIKNPIVKFIVGLIITVGDRIKEKVCGA
jgi:hypothetical protein